MISESLPDGVLSSNDEVYPEKQEKPSKTKVQKMQ